MRKNFILFSGKYLLIILSIGLSCFKSFAQLPTCTGASAGFIYYLSSGNIYNLNPALPLSATNPSINTIAPPSGADGISLGPNLNAATPNPTFYVCDGSGNYYYYNGTTWVNTGFNSGNTAAVNPAGGGNYIYNLVGGTGQIYRYNGSSNGSLLVTLSNFSAGGPFDLQSDCAGNFYILQDVGSTPGMYEYSSSGSLINSWTLTNQPSTGSGGGFGIIGNNVYADVGGAYYQGVISGGNVSFTQIGTLNPSSEDFATCPLGGVAQSRNDTAYVCSGGAGKTLQISGAPPYSWTVINGTASVAGSGNTVTVTASANAVVVGQSINTTCSGGGPFTDTFHIIVPTALVSAGLPATVYGCGVYADTLLGSLTDTISWITYNRQWTPALSIASGANTLKPIIHPVANTKYILTVSTPAAQGGCTFSDSGLVTVVDKSVKARFVDTVHYGCLADTNYFTNQSLAQSNQFWDFGDGHGSTSLSPEHIYTSQGVHSVLLTVTNVFCTDSIRKTVDPPHPIHASFTVSADTVCQNQMVTLTNTSTGTFPTYQWNLGNGVTDTSASISYTYVHEGVYLITLAEKDFVPCYDTARMYITVDSQSFIKFTTSDSVLCQGKAVTFTGSYINIGYTGNTWTFGDGTTINNTNPIEHGYELPGTYLVSLTADYRVCPDTTIKKNITVFAYPAVNVGSDTSMCPNANPIQLTEVVNAGNAAAKWLWNTGDTTASILVTQPGVYYTTVTLNGCSSADSIWVKNDCYLSIPNVFTPNNDGVNDYFFPRQELSAGATSFTMNVFNRWGQLIFETQNINGRGWDGKFNGQNQPEGVYIYTIDVSFKDGETEHYKGNVTLLR